jgi:hypothetical protein
LSGLATAVRRLRRRVALDIAMRGTPDLCFIWVPKAAGTSLFNALNAACGMRKLDRPGRYFAFPNRGAVTFGHVHYLSLLRAGIVSRDYDARTYRFAVVRNPYARVVSLYNYLGGHVPEVADASFDAFLEACETARPPVGMYNACFLSQANPQVDWLVGERGGVVCDVFRVEDLAPLQQRLREVAGVSLDLSYRANVSQSRRADLKRDLLEHRARLDRVNAIYARDFRVLGYEML